MPNYDFKCQQCGKVTEALTGMTVIQIECNCGGVADRQIERTHQRRMDAHQRTSRTGDEWRPGQHPQLCNLYVFAKT